MLKEKIRDGRLQLVLLLLIKNVPFMPRGSRGHEINTGTVNKFRTQRIFSHSWCPKYFFYIFMKMKSYRFNKNGNAILGVSNLPCVRRGGF